MGILHKFRFPNSYAFECLEKREIYFAAPSELNDPLDCQLDVGGILSVAITKMKDEDAKIMAQIQEFYATEKATGKKILLSDAHRDFVAKAGVFSMSGNPSDMLLWSHYANSHQGFCIGFDTKLIVNFFKDGKANHAIGGDNVLYLGTPEPPEGWFDPVLEHVKAIRKSGKNATDQDHTDLQHKYRELVTTFFFRLKSKAWEYENEFRLITFGSRLVPFEPTDIAEIVFGVRTTDLVEAKVRDILKGADWSHVAFKRAKPVNNSFALELVNC